MKQLFFLNTIKTHPILLKKFSMLFLIILVLGTLMGTVQGQAVYVDKVDYMPGDIININGYAWRPGEVVSVVLTENYLNPEGKLITSKSFTCDYQGKFSGILYTVVEANLGAFFQLKATGSITNHVCTTVFHDAGGDYSIDYSAYDPQYYNRLSVSTLFPDGIPAGGLTGNMTSPLALGGSAGSTMHTHTVESLSPQFLGLGQIVSFEFYISADAGSACPNDKISFGGSWSTLTQNSEDFGFDPNFKVIAAFVDPSVEATFQDGGSPASARILSNDVINNNIEAMFEVSGLDPGDKFPVEIWLVLKSSIAASVGSNVPTGAINGLTLGTCETGEAVRMGNQTVPLLQAGDFFTTDVDVLITKSDSQDPVAIGAEFYYTLTVTNNGPSVANNINISDILNNNFNVDVDAILFSHNISTGFVDDPAWSHSFDLATHTLTLTKLSIDLGETIYIKVPVIWVPPYSGTKTSGSAGPGAAGSSCTGDLINKVSITTISDDINSANDSYCQPTNVICSTVSANAGPDKVLNCSVTSLSLDATLIQGLDYSWVASNGGNIVSGANTAAPTVDEPGTYTLTITDPASGCYATDVALVTQNISAPVAEAGTPKVLNCTVTSIALAGSSSTEGATFSWAGPGIVSGGSTLTPTVNVAGTYILTVTGPNGCQLTDNVLVTLDSAAPVAEAGTPKVLNCTVTSIALAGSSSTEGATFSWAGPGIVSGNTTLTPTVNVAGTYTLTVTGPNGCQSTDNVLVTLDSAAPVAEAGGPKVLNCTVTSIALAGSSSTEGATFSWAGPGIVSGGTTLTPTVNVAGTYILTVTGPNGCQSTDNVLVTLDSAAPVAEAGGPKVLNCTVTSIALAGSSSTEGATFSWAGPGIVSGGSTLTPTVNVAGTYVLTVTGPNGCQSTDNVLVNLDNELPNVNAGADKVLSCTVTSVTLNGSSTNQGASFLWTGPGIVSGGNTLTPVINATGSYILTVTASNGCIAADAIEVTMNIDKEPPVIECPAPITVACASAIPDPVLPRATDNCGIDKVEWLGDVKSNETCEQRFTITRTFRATDVNGFTSECTQIITVNDNIAPALKPGAVFPAGQADVNLCKASIPAGPSVEEIKALYADNCGGEVVVFKSGAPTGDDCSWSVTYTYIVKDMCRNYVVGVPTVTYSGGDKTPPSLKPGASFPAGQTSMNLCKASIPAGPSVDEIKALYMDNCGGNITVINLGGQVTGDDCNWSVTYTYRVKDACYNEILPRPTITYSGGDKIAPVLKPGATFPVGQTGMNLCKSSVPAGPSLEEIKALYMDNCGGSITVINLGGLISGDDSNWSVTYTYRIKDACYNEVLPRPTITFSGSDMTAPVLKPGATLPAGQTGINSPMSSIPEGPSAEEIKDLYMDNCGGEITVTGLTRTVTGDDSSWSVVYTYSVVDGNNNEVLPGPAITYSGSSKTPPTILPDNGETEYTIEGCDMEFRLPKPTVTGECSGEIILKAYVGSTEIDLSSYKFENEGVTIVTFIATDACGNSSTSAITVNRLECIDKSHCTYTQDWYGSQGSTNCVFVDGTYQKLDALSMMTTAFTDLTSVTFGDKSAQKYFDLMKESISGTAAYEGIFQMLPGGGTPAALLGPSSSMDPIGRTAGRWVNIPRSTELSNRGTIMNSLLSHTIALFFNLENDGSLGEFELRGRYMVTAKSTECGSETTVPNSSTYVEFPLSVLDYFSSNSLTGTIDDLYKLANDVLGGVVTSVSASDVEKAVIAVNKGFDGCRVLIEFSQNVPSVPKATAGATDIRTSISASKDINEVTLTVYPNPFAQFVKFEIEMLLDSHVRIDIFSTSGTLLDVLLNESLSQGDSRTVEFDGSKYPHSSFLYRITTNGTLLNGTILKTK